MSPENRHLTPFDFDVLCLTQSGPALASLAAHLESCPACREEQRLREHLIGQFEHELLPRSLPAIRERLTARRGWRFRRWPLAVSALACGAVLAVVGLHNVQNQQNARPTSIPNDRGDLGIKGGNTLVTYVRHGGKVSRLANGAVVSAGDALRFVVETGASQYLFIAGVDGTGHATAYFPYGDWRSAPVAPRSRFEVPGSLVLDDARGPERIFAMLSRQPLDRSDVQPILTELAGRGPQAIRATVAPGVPGATVSSILLEKRE